MSDTTVIPSVQPIDSGEPIIPLSAINQYLYCPRRAGLIHVEGVFTDNEHTVVGSQLHKEVDTPSYETVRGVTLLRALPVWSARLGLSGKCDIVERHPDGSLVPVEFKKGKRRKFDNDDAQLCAQPCAWKKCSGRTFPRGHLPRQKQAPPGGGIHRGLAPPHRTGHRGRAPTDRGGSRSPPVHKPQCSECSLFESCMPEITSSPPTLAQAGRDVFDTGD